MLDSIGYCGIKIIGKSFLENSFGEGVVLLESVKRYIEVAKSVDLSRNEIANQLSGLFCGYEIDKKLYDSTIQKLNMLIKSSDIGAVDWSLYNEDFLTSDLKQNFDYIVGNPPYIKYQEIDGNVRSILKSTFESCKSGKFDYCYPFIEKSIDLTSEQGKMAYLVPSSIFKNVFAKRLRKLMLPSLYRIEDFSGNSLFSDATTASAIIYFNRGYSTEKLEYATGNNQRVLQKTALSQDKWIFEIKGSKSSGKRFGDYFRVQNSPATLRNSIFVHKVEKTGIDYLLERGEKIEQKILLDAFSAGSISRGERLKIIFPYKRIGSKAEKMTEEELSQNYPLALSYLKMHRRELSKRAVDKSMSWFEFGRSQGLSNIFSEKIILSSVLTHSVNPTLLSDVEIPFSGFYITQKRDLSLQQGMKILENSEMKDYLLSVGISVNGKSKRLSVKDIEDYHFRSN